MKNKQTPLYRPNSNMTLEEYKDLISYHLTEIYQQTDQLDIADARQQDEIDYLRKRVEVLEMTTNKCKDCGSRTDDVIKNTDKYNCNACGVRDEYTGEH